MILSQLIGGKFRKGNPAKNLKTMSILSYIAELAAVLLANQKNAAPHHSSKRGKANRSQ